MGGGGAGAGDKRSVNAEINLVPYIDLLSTLICFLLITAVWQQIATLSTEGTNAATSDSATPPKEDKVELSISVFTDKTDITAGKETRSFAHVAGNPDYGSIVRVLEYWRKTWPDRKDVTLNTDSRIPYKYLIGVMDTLAEKDFVDVGVNTQ